MLALPGQRLLAWLTTESATAPSLAFNDRFYAILSTSQLTVRRHCASMNKIFRSVSLILSDFSGVLQNVHVRIGSFASFTHHRHSRRSIVHTILTR